MNKRETFHRFAAVLLIAAMPLFAFAGASGRGNSITIDAPGGYATATLTIQMPDEELYTATYRGGQPIVFNLKDLPGTDVLDGSYSYQVTFAPHVPPGVAKKLADSRAAGDDKAAKKILADAGISIPAAAGGHFLVNQGAIVDTGAAEADANDARLGTPTTNGTGRDVTTNAGVTDRFNPEANTQVVPEDLVVQGSECVGIDCTATESFGFDTIRMKENNLRIKAEDTSTSAGFPSSDWQLTFNDSTSGGANKFSVEEISAALVPFTVEGGTPTNSLFVDSSGNVGLGTNGPALDLTIATNNTPGIRLDQNNTGGFTAQTWDIAGNEANFFVRDLTGGSLLSFRIRPGAPTSSIDIASDGQVGMGTADPQSNLDVRGANAHVLVGSGTADFIGPAQTGYGASNGTEKLFFAVQTNLGFLGTQSNTNLGFVTNNVTRMTVTTAGNVGIGTLTPGSQLVIVNGASSSSINAGSAQFTVASSRTFKDNIAPVEAPDILSKIESVPVVTYDYKQDGPKDRMGLIAEDFYQVFGRGDDKHIDGHDVQMALWLAVQKLTAENKALTDELKSQKQQLLDRIAAIEAQATKQ